MAEPARERKSGCLSCRYPDSFAAIGAQAGGIKACLAGWAAIRRGRRA
jgi:hypothetical protein